MRFLLFISGTSIPNEIRTRFPNDKTEIIRESTSDEDAVYQMSFMR